MRNSKFIALLLAFALILGSFGFAFADDDAAAPADAPETTAAPADDPVDPAPEDGEPAESGDIVILHTNDVHCANYENYAKLVELAKSADFVVDAGDAIQGGPIGALSKGEYITEIMNYVKYDVVAPGNHEFDYGMEQFKKITGEVAEFPFVCCNLVDLKTGEPMFDAYKMEIEKDFIPYYTWARLNKPYDEISLEEKVEFLKHDVFGECVYKT
ncbi:MAG: metallophosphoesterase, partial [Firmicutes bacterium]|nr:metallophosphoesterase [Bacillota bacterium]